MLRVGLDREQRLPCPCDRRDIRRGGDRHQFDPGGRPRDARERDRPGVPSVVVTNGPDPGVLGITVGEAAVEARSTRKRDGGVWLVVGFRLNHARSSGCRARSDDANEAGDRDTGKGQPSDGPGAERAPPPTAARSERQSGSRQSDHDRIDHVSGAILRLEARIPARLSSAIAGWLRGRPSSVARCLFCGLVFRYIFLDVPVHAGERSGGTTCPLAIDVAVHARGRRPLLSISTMQHRSSTGC